MIRKEMSVDNVVGTFTRESLGPSRGGADPLKVGYEARGYLNYSFDDHIDKLPNGRRYAHFPDFKMKSWKGSKHRQSLILRSGFSL